MPQNIFLSDTSKPAKIFFLGTKAAQNGNNSHRVNTL
jgi:hypothetical protein